MRFVDFLLKLLPSKPVYAHCDIPCGIYDPHNMQMAAHTVIRMTTMINELTASSDNAPFDERKKIIHQLSRLTKVKEEHAELLKHELRVLWGDYFKDEHLKDYPDLHDLVFKTLKLASKARQEINLDAANELLGNTQKIAEIFYKTKGKEPVRVPSVYPTEGEMVIYK
jgi:nickel superoxide dismutase